MSAVGPRMIKGGFKAAFFAPLFVLALSACLSEGVAASDFTYKGKPIDPMCLSQDLEEEGEAISLAECTGSVGACDATMAENGLETFPDGSIGYTFKCTDGCMRPPFVSYKYLGMTDGLFAVQTHESGGGTGYFSGVHLYAIDGDKLIRRKTLGAGDRCNGGISDVAVKDGVLRYSVNVTPFDLVELAGGNDAGFVAYEDIQACAACCVGTAEYTGDTLTGVTLSDDAAVEPGDAQGADTCFSKVYDAAFRQSPALDTARLQKFGRDFDAACGKLKK